MRDYQLNFKQLSFLFLFLLYSIVTSCGVKTNPKEYPDTALEAYQKSFLDDSYEIVPIEKPKPPPEK